MVFFSSATKASIAISCVVAFAGIVLFLINKIKVKTGKDIIYEIIKEKKAKINCLLSIVISLFHSFLFFRIWRSDATVKKIFNVCHIDTQTGLLVIAAIGFVINFYFLYNLFSRFFTQKKAENSLYVNSTNKVNYKQHIFIFLIALVSISLLSTSSFLYPFNIWNDSNCFFTVGKSVLSGLVPYRDLFEQKGPLLYFIHTLAALISYKTFFGVYILEVIAAYVFLLFSYKTMCLYVDKKVIYLLPILSFAIYSSNSFLFGDSAEEFCLPLLMYGLYVSLKSIKNKENIPFKEALFIGITSGMVLWIKYTMLGFYIGWIILPAILLIFRKDIKELFKLVSAIALGVAIPSVFVLAYFAINDSLSDLFTVYFYNNMFLYSANTSSNILLNVYKSGYTALVKNRFLYIFILASIVYMFVKKRNALNYLLIYVFTITFIFMGSNSYDYYTLILSVFAPLGIAFCYEACCNFKLTGSKLTALIIAIAQVTICIILLVNCNNFYLLGTDKDELVQYRFSEKINEVEDATLLNYGALDIGVYTTSGIVPNNKYFAKLNIKIDEMYEGQDECLKNKDVDFVVTRNQEIDFDGYELVDQYDMFFTNKVYTYRLYQLVE